MQANVGLTDKTIRLVLALPTVVFAFVTGLGKRLRPDPPGNRW